MNHEPRDFSVRAVAWTVGSFLILLVFLPALLWWIYHGELQQQSRDLRETGTAEFALPRLQDESRSALRDRRHYAEPQLNTYAWVDEHHQAAQVPIERAMEIAVDKKLISAVQEPKDVR